MHGETAGDQGIHGRNRGDARDATVSQRQEPVREGPAQGHVDFRLACGPGRRPQPGPFKGPEAIRDILAAHAPP